MQESRGIEQVKLWLLNGAGNDILRHKIDQVVLRAGVRFGLGYLARFAVVLNLAWGGAFVSPSWGQESSIIELGVPEEIETCGDRSLSIVQMQWPSSIVLAHIHAIILREELGCDVQIVSGDMAASTSSMAASGEPAIAPELWITRIAPIWNSVLETNRVRTEAPTFSGEDFEGWFLSAQLAEQLPSLKSVGALKEGLLSLTNELQAETQSDTEVAGSPPVQKVRFISCPADWACSVLNKNLLEAYGLRDVLDFVEPANRFEMDVLIAQAVSRHEPVVFYYWQPNGVLAQFDFKALDMGEFNEENFKCLAQHSCTDPQISSFANEKAFIVVADWVSEEVPLVSRYLRGATLPVSQMNEILNWRSQGDVEFEKLAARFVSEREDIWRVWVDGLR